MKSVNDRPDYLKHLEFEPRFNCDSLEEMKIKFAVQVAEMRDQAILEAIIKVAQEEKLTDLYLIDRDFIIRALQNQINLESKDKERVSAEFQRALTELNYYRNQYYTETQGTERRVIADALNVVLPIISRYFSVE